MRLKMLVVGLVPVLVAVFPSAATAQSDQQFKQCNGTDPVLAIVGCTTVILSPDSNPPLQSRALVNRANAYVARGQPDRAIADFDRAVMLDPKNSIAFAARGAYYQAQGESDGIFGI